MEGYFLFYNNCMKQINYTEEILKKQLMHLYGYSDGAASQIVGMYRCNCELDDLECAISEKDKAVQRL